MDFPSPTPKQARAIWFALTALAVAVCVGLLTGLLWGLGKMVDLLSPVLWPLAVAGVIACVLDPVVDFLERRRVSRSAAILLTFLAGLLVIGLFFWSTAPRLVDEAGQLLARVPGYSRQVQARVTQWMAAPPKQWSWLLPHGGAGPSHPPPPPATNDLVMSATTNLTNLVLAPTATESPEDPAAWQQRIIRSATGWATTELPKAASWFFDRLVQVSSIFGVLVGLGLVPVYAFYFLQEKEGIQSKWADYLPVQDSRFKEELVFVLRSIQGYLVAFFRGQVLVATCDAVLYTVGFLAMGLNYAFILGFMAQLLTLVPFIGAMIVCGTAVLLAAVQFQDVLHPLLALGVFGLVQALEGLLISPKIMGDRVGLHPLTILVAVMVGTNLLGGVLGGVLAIPLTAALRVIMFRYVWKAPEATRKRTGL